MSLNKAVNATIALIEGRTDIAKEIFRDPTSDIKNIPEVMARLEAAVNKVAARAIRNGLMRSLAIEVTISELSDISSTTSTLDAASGFNLGVTKVEDLFQSIVEELDPDEVGN